MKINDNGTERNATAEEIAYYEAWQADIEATTQTQAEAEANRQAIKEAVLNKLGLTADEVAALLS
jgi:phosphopantetheinyl transferase (holo-ACP synthase)